jgi:parallel beta-helix repeat protein
MSSPLARTQILRALSIACLLLTAIDASADSNKGHENKDPGRTWRVANNGVDDSTCGGVRNPCRSISQAIANATAGDTILVGPGRYGDLNGDGDFDDPGDEQARVGTGIGCVVCINKQVRVLSTDGATATMVDGESALPHGELPFVIYISTSGVTLGQRHRGFTIKNGQMYGVKSDAADLHVAGNTALNNPDYGFELTGSGEVSHNTAIGNARGFTVEGTFLLSYNTAFESMLNGFSSTGAATALFLIGNRASGNLIGFSVSGESLVLKHNVASGNVDGVSVDSPNLTIVRNTIVGNRSAGLYVGPRVTADNATIRQNNIFGNDGTENAPNDVTTNCGLVSQYGNVVDATFNYWGAPTGPGPDPADAAGPGSGCDLSGSQTQVVPFATRPF